MYLTFLCIFSSLKGDVKCPNPCSFFSSQDTSKTRKPWGLSRLRRSKQWLYVRHPWLSCLRQSRDPQRLCTLLRQDGWHVEPGGHAVHHAGWSLPLPRPGPSHTVFQNSQRPVLFARGLVAQGQMSTSEPAEERTLWETHSIWATHSPVVPPAAIVARGGAGWTGSELGRTDGAVLWRRRG